MMSAEHFENARAEIRRRISLESWKRSWNLIDPAVVDYQAAHRNYSLDHFADERQYGRDIDWSSRIEFYADYCEKRRLSDCLEVHPTSDECARGVADSDVRPPAEGIDPDAELPRPVPSFNYSNRRTTTESYCEVEPSLSSSIGLADVLSTDDASEPVQSQPKSKKQRFLARCRKGIRRLVRVMCCCCLK